MTTQAPKSEFEPEKGTSEFPDGGTDTNPFSDDLKGEFTSNFGTTTNAVSQIFKEGGFGDQSRSKYIIAGVLALVVVLIGVFIFLFGTSETEVPVVTSDFAETDAFPAEDEAEDPFVADEEGEDAFFDEEEELASDSEASSDLDQAVSEEAGDEFSAGQESASQSAAGEPLATGNGAIQLVSPAAEANRPYDETASPAEFSWEGSPGAEIVFSRSPSMSPVERQIFVQENFYLFHNPYPGTWYWQVRNSDGASDVRSFRIGAPVKRNLVISQPASGGAVSGSGGVVSWQGDNKVAFYRVELSNGSWANPPFRFATAGNSVQLNGVAPGQYQLRVGGFSEVSGRWEYTNPISVSVQ